MRVVVAFACLLLVVVLVRRDHQVRSAAGSSVTAVASPAATASEDAITAHSDTAGARHTIEWGAAIDWKGWEEGLAAAQQHGRPLCLVVYANWCARCKELAPVFSQPQVAAMARGVVMVRQDQDEQPAWLRERFGELGGYVPRVLFLDPRGKLMPQYQSGHPRYPYFYSRHVADRLVANMYAAIGG